MTKDKFGIEAVNINKSFGKKQVLNQVSLAVPKGTIFGLLGPSGCGKTTTIKIIAGILRADSGTVSVLGEPMPDLKLMEEIGYMTQSAALYPTLSAAENLKFFGSLYGLKGQSLKDRIAHIAALVDLEADLKTKVSAYSGGMKQRLSLGISLLADPEILLLDEPTVGIDPVLRHTIWQELDQLAAEGITILITTHVMDEAAKCHQLAMMRDGVVLAQGTAEDIQAQAQCNTIEDAFIFFGAKAMPQEEGDLNAH